MKNENGFTLIELMIVLAILAIMGAIITPQFMTSLAKARLKSDIQSASVINNAIELYNAERDEELLETKADISSVLEELKKEKYIASKSTTEEKPQSKNLSWKLEDNIIKLSGDVDEDIKESLLEEEKYYIAK